MYTAGQTCPWTVRVHNTRYLYRAIRRVRSPSLFHLLIFVLEFWFLEFLNVTYFLNSRDFRAPLVGLLFFRWEFSSFFYRKLFSANLLVINSRVISVSRYTYNIIANRTGILLRLHVFSFYVLGFLAVISTNLSKFRANDNDFFFCTSQHNIWRLVHITEEKSNCPYCYNNCARYLEEWSGKGYPANHSVYACTLEAILIYIHIGIVYTNIHNNIIYYTALRFL